MTGVGSGLSYGLGYTDWDGTLCNGTKKEIVSLVLCVCVVLVGDMGCNLFSVLGLVLMYGLLNCGGSRTDGYLHAWVTLRLSDSPPDQPSPQDAIQSVVSTSSPPQPSTTSNPPTPTTKLETKSPSCQRLATILTPLPAHTYIPQYINTSEPIRPAGPHCAAPHPPTQPSSPTQHIHHSHPRPICGGQVPFHHQPTQPTSPLHPFSPHIHPRHAMPCHAIPHLTYPFQTAYPPTQAVNPA